MLSKNVINSILKWIHSMNGAQRAYAKSRNILYFFLILLVILRAKCLRWFGLFSTKENLRAPYLAWSVGKKSNVSHKTNIMPRVRIPRQNEAMLLVPWEWYRFVTRYVCVKVINAIDATHLNIRLIVWSIIRQYIQNIYDLWFIIVLWVDAK